MGFFENIGKKASAAYDATAEKTSKIAKEAKLKMKMNENKSDINDLYKEIGKKVYEKHVREENIDIKTELEEECTKIDVLSAEIETCLKTILELKDRKQCLKCYAEIELESAYCPKCGEKQSDENIQESDTEYLGEKDNEQNNDDVSIETQVEQDVENTVEKVTEIHAIEVQEDSKNQTDN